MTEDGPEIEGLNHYHDRTWGVCDRCIAEGERRGRLAGVEAYQQWMNDNDYDKGREVLDLYLASLNEGKIDG